MPLATTRMPQQDIAALKGLPRKSESNETDFGCENTFAFLGRGSMCK